LTQKLSCNKTAVNYFWDESKQFFMVTKNCSSKTFLSKASPSITGFQEKPEATFQEVIVALSVAQFQKNMRQMKERYGNCQSNDSP